LIGNGPTLVQAQGLALLDDQGIFLGWVRSRDQDKALLGKRAIIATRREFSWENGGGVCVDGLLIQEDEKKLILIYEGSLDCCFFDSECYRYRKLGLRFCRAYTVMTNPQP